MRVAVVLFNLGGPASLEAVEPFLFNLFHDPAIIRVPQPFRWLLAKFISKRRAPVAREIYAKMGGRSPILGQTYNQASELKTALTSNDGTHFETFVAMRYTAPRASDIVEQVRRYRPNKIVLLPLYPQFSTTTSRSSLREWNELARERKIGAPVATVCCYPQDAGFIEAQAALIAETIDKLPPNVRFRLLFSAHGLPESVVSGGDPYKAQVEQTAAALVKALSRPQLDSRVCFQSRVGPMKWIGPATDEEIKRAGTEGLALVVAPIAFVSEHSETLVELDIEYAKLAAESGIAHYLRAPAVGTHPRFIEGLAALVKDAAKGQGTKPGGATRTCPAACVQCALERKIA
ncbi:MAG: ferrochelatase [Alphaproteobacteria bacterium]|nr:ferrochelatase [Alphaproteobacteria bacterium]